MAFFNDVQEHIIYLACTKPINMNNKENKNLRSVELERQRRLSVLKRLVDGDPARYAKYLSEVYEEAKAIQNRK